MWDALLGNQDVLSLLVTPGKGRQAAKISENRMRMHLYLRLERLVMDAVVEELEVDGNTPVLIHDGFMVRRRANVSALEEAVLKKTGLAIRLSETLIGGDLEGSEGVLECDVEELVDRT
jgi:hypothetical protein